MYDILTVKLSIIVSLLNACFLRVAASLRPCVLWMNTYDLCMIHAYLREIVGFVQFNLHFSESPPSRTPPRPFFLLRGKWPFFVFIIGVTCMAWAWLTDWWAWYKLYEEFWNHVSYHSILPPPTSWHPRTYICIVHYPSVYTAAHHPLITIELAELEEAGGRGSGQLIQTDSFSLIMTIFGDSPL